LTCRGWGGVSGLAGTLVEKMVRKAAKMPERIVSKVEKLVRLVEFQRI